MQTEKTKSRHKGRKGECVRLCPSNKKQKLRNSCPGRDVHEHKAQKNRKHENKGS